MHFQCKQFPPLRTPDLRECCALTDTPALVRGGQPVGDKLKQPDDPKNDAVNYAGGNAEHQYRPRYCK